MVHGCVYIAHIYSYRLKVGSSLLPVPEPSKEEVVAWQGNGKRGVVVGGGPSAERRPDEEDGIRRG